MIDFRTKKTRIRVLQSIFYVAVVGIYVPNYGYSFYYLLGALVSSFMEIDTQYMRSSWNRGDSYLVEQIVLAYILLSPLLIYWLLMPLYRSIKRWVFRGQ